MAAPSEWSSREGSRTACRAAPLDAGGIWPCIGERGSDRLSSRVVSPPSVETAAPTDHTSGPLCVTSFPQPLSPLPWRLVAPRLRRRLPPPLGPPATRQPSPAHPHRSKRLVRLKIRRGQGAQRARKGTRSRGRTTASSRLRRKHETGCSRRTVSGVGSSSRSRARN